MRTYFILTSSLDPAIRTVTNNWIDQIVKFFRKALLKSILSLSSGLKPVVEELCLRIHFCL